MLLELLAPARDADVARVALMCGADAVYIGGPDHGARSAACNSIDDIERVVDMAHGYGARVYVTLNTIIYDDELVAVERTISDLYRIGVDALIVQDMSLLRMDIPPIDLHASTQCDIRTPERAAFLARQGFSQLVLPRELSLDQIRAVRKMVPTDVALEAFVHGALCVCYSGDCHASYAAFGRSANRGECAQMCRMAYDLTDADGNVLVANRHFLSLRDMNRLNRIAEMADAGISSFKIEGRLKDAAYVANVVTAYRRAIDDVIAANPGKYQRSSFGHSDVPFDADVNSVFNRGFTTYFLDGRPADTARMANHVTPKWVGVAVGTVKSHKDDCIVADLTAELHNGDGITYFTDDKQFAGFRLNRIEGNRLYPATRVNLRPGTKLYRNRDTARDASFNAARLKRTIGVDMRLYLPAGQSTVALTLTAENGTSVTATTTAEISPARSEQTEPRRRTLTKLGDTPYVITNYADDIEPSLFVAASTLSTLRRQACSDLDAAIRLNHRFKYRLSSDNTPHTSLFTLHSSLDYHSNVANRLARQFYLDNGAKSVEDAMEVTSQTKDRVVMTTRYCLRRELGACLRTPNGGKLPKSLCLRNDAATYELSFDCANCQMQLINRR